MKQQEERGKVMVRLRSVWMVRENQVAAVSMVEFEQGVECMLIGGGVLKT
jgi:hypothetical protein